MPDLKLVKPDEGPFTMNVFLYGPPKNGKTIGGASIAPVGKTLYLNADTANATRFAHKLFEFDEVHVENLQTLLDAMLAIKEGKYECVVVDPIADVYRLVIEGLSNRALSPAIQQYGDTGTYLERFCRELCEQPVNAVLIAHDQAVPNEETGGVEHLPFVSTKAGSPVLAGKLMAMVDVIGYTGVVEKENEPTEYVAQLINSKGRRGGDRFGVLGKSRSLDLAEWHRLAGDSLKTEKKTAAKAA